MAKRKKYPKLPNGFGSIKYLGKGRRNPYGVYPPVKEFVDGVPKTPKALCYVDEWMKGFAVLNAYHSGTFVPKMELNLDASSSSADKLAQKIIADYSYMRNADHETYKTFIEVYEEFYDDKYVKDKSREYAPGTINNTKTAFSYCKKLYDVPFKNIRLSDMQDLVDDLPLKRGTKIQVVSFFRQMYSYAMAHEIVDKDYSAAVKVRQKNDEEHGVPFSQDELDVLWANKDDDIAELLLILCYSGFRINATHTLYTDLEEMYFKGGVKTRAGKDRIVPIHSSIYPLVQSRLSRHGCLMPYAYDRARTLFRGFIKRSGINYHTFHDCRHTFSMLCEKYGVNENDRKRLLGHSFRQDITNAVYGHRSLEDLRIEVEKIKV